MVCGFFSGKCWDETVRGVLSFGCFLFGGWVGG